MPITLAYAEPDSEIARRIAADLSNVRLKQGENVLIAVISPAAVANPDVLRQIETAAGQYQLVLPVLVDDAPLPPQITRPALDFRGSTYPIDELKRQVLGESASSPILRRRNMRAGLVIAIAALVMFGVGLYGIGVLGIRAPQDEFDAVETQRVQQRNTLIAPTLEPLIPVGQFAISQFELTVTAVPTRLREYLIQTVTATAQGTFIPSLTPRPTEE
jgi:hypothetical protein